MADPTVAEALAEAARGINSSSTVEETLQAIAHSARMSIPGVEHAGISTVDRKGLITTRASTGPIVAQLDQLQYDLNEGPCIDSIRESAIVSVPDIRHEQRWPRYVPEAIRRTGLRSQMGVRLFLDDRGTVGGLNLYSTQDQAITEDAAEVAQLFATHAALALGHASTVSQLTDAMSSRKVIGQALGILMERYQLDEERAFGFLTRASSHGNLKLREVAQRLVDDAQSTVGRARPEDSTGTSKK